MPKPAQDYTARRFQSCDAGYDCELPPDVRTELGRPKRARVLGRPKSIPLDPATRTRLYLTGFVVLMLAASLIAMWVNHKSPEQLQAVKEAIAKENATLSPAPAPMPTPHTSWQSYLAAQQTPAPRAILVKLPPPRAELIRLPEWRIGEERQLLLPYGLRVLGRYKGRLVNEAMLPADGNAIGDAFAIDDNVWVWLAIPGSP